MQVNAQPIFQFDTISIPAFAGENKIWSLQANLSDDFNYTYNPNTANASFGADSLSLKWNNYFLNDWEGPGPTIWRRDHVQVKDGHLELWVSREEGETKFLEHSTAPAYPATRAGCVTSKETISYPAFIEARVRVMNATIASNVWLLSEDSQQEIDVMEAYGGLGLDGRNTYFSERIHLSHHTFVREPFQDYQPLDWNSWYTQSDVNQWGNMWLRVGIHWASATRLEYYINGELVRILDDTAIASKLPDGTWQYTYPAGFDDNTGLLKKATSGFQTGYQEMITANSLEEAKSLSNISVIDAYDYLGNGKQLDGDLHIIFDIEDQDWLALGGRSPTDEELQNRDNHTYKIDWIRVYKPENSSCQEAYIDLNGNQITRSITVSDIIQSNGFVDSGFNISYKAGNYLEFNNNFEVKLGAAFEGLIEGCVAQ